MPEKTLRDCGVQQYGYPIFKLLVEVYPQKLFPCAGEQCGPEPPHSHFRYGYPQCARA